ncbi:MAG: hypothetical protein HGB33_03670 [Syntrophaceae bacterium]|nr:hypothetical protein [Syntrophaceae bacterium]
MFIVIPIPNQALPLLTQPALVQAKVFGFRGVCHPAAPALSPLIQYDGLVKRPDAALRVIPPRPSPGQATCGIR